MQKISRPLIVALLSTILSLQTVNAKGKVITDDDVVYSKSKERKAFTYDDSLEPILGYINAQGKGGMGILKSFDNILQEDADVHLTINFKLQQKIEKLLDKQQDILHSDEVIAMVMESNTGKLVAMATSKRYNPNHVSSKDIYAMVPKCIKYPYEPGGTIKPFVFAMALEKQRLDTSTIFNTYGGDLYIEDATTIHDNKKFDALSAEEIILHSSNVGIVQVSWLLSGLEFREGLENFGFSHPTGIELVSEKKGFLNPVKKFNKQKYRAYTSIGYGLTTTPVQLLKAYNLFNNQGKNITPHLHKHHTNLNEMQTISKSTALTLHKILIENATKKLPKDAEFDGINIGLQSATAYIYSKGKYRRQFHTSVYGFVNDNFGHKYTLGILTIRPKEKNAYYPSRSAIPIFKSILVAMKKMGFITHKNK